MSDSPLFKRAFVRGLNAELMRQGVVHFPTKEAADHAADYVADNFCPDPINQGADITLKVAHTLCTQLDAAGQHFCKAAGDKYLPSLNKVASATDPEELALQEAWQLMQKAAAETGSIYEGGDAPNDMPAASSENAEAALESSRRPENYANLGESGVGDMERKGEGAVGTEEKHPEAPKATDGGGNSATEHSKTGADSLASIVRKVAEMGAMLEPGKNKNDMPAAAAHNAEAALEQSRRPENYANKGEAGVGRSDMVPDAVHQIGKEQPHPEAPAATASGKMNVPLEHTKSAFDQLFELTARDVVGYLPENMSDTQKVAHIRANMGLETEKRAEYLHGMWETLAPSNADAVRSHYLKTAEARQKLAEDEMEGKEFPFKKKDDDDDESASKSLPPALKEKMEESDDDDDDDDDSKKEAAAPDTKQALSSLHQKLASLSHS